MTVEEYNKALIREARKASRNWISHNSYIATLLKDLADKLDEYIRKYQLSLENNVDDSVRIATLEKALDKACERISTIQGGGTKEWWKEWCLDENK